MTEKLWGVDEDAYRRAIMGKTLRMVSDKAGRPPCFDSAERNLDILRMANSGTKYEVIGAEWGLTGGGVGKIVHKMRKQAADA